MENRLVSVVIPAHNCAGTIACALDSVLAQDVPLEILVIDDQSSDDLDAVLEPYHRLPFFYCYKNESNLGAARSRNRGVRLAHGDYVAFLDADDWWEEGKLKKQMALIEWTGTVLCSAGRELLTPEGERTGRIIGVRPRITYRSLLLHNCINCSSVVLRTDVAREFPMEHEDSHEDYITWLRILEKYGEASAVDEPLLKYRLSSKGKSGSKLHSAGMTFRVYRYLGFGYLKSCFCFAAYAVNGVRKYLFSYFHN